MEVAVFMETSGAVRDALIGLGYRAISIDILPAQNGGPHHQGDAFEFMLANQGRFAAAVFHPECTYFTGSAAWAFKDPDFDRYPGVGYHQRLKAGTLFGAARRQARENAERELEMIRVADMPLKIIENPVGSISTRTKLGKPQQIVQPYEFGADASKKTCLWFINGKGEKIATRGLPIDPALYVEPRMVDGRPRWANQTDGGQNCLTPGENRWQVRSDTYPGIAAGLAAYIHNALTIGG